MRLRRNLVLSALVALALAALVVAARGQARRRAREQAEVLRLALADRLDAYREHARYLARRSGDQIAGYLTHFRGLASVCLYDAGDRPLLALERRNYLVARLPGARAPALPALRPDGAQVALSGFEVAADRLDVHPSRRQVVRYAARRPDGGTLVLTVIAAPLLQPLRDAGANLLDETGRPLLGPTAAGERAAGEKWAVVLPAGPAFSGLFLALGAAVLLLGAAAGVWSERQIRQRERRAVAERLAQADRLQSLGLLTAGIAHEINNPLEGIANWLRLGNVPKAEEGFERIRSIVRDLLAFARPAPGEGRADPKRALARALELARFAASFGGVAVEDRVEEGVFVNGAPRMLEQVCLNLLLNAGAATAGQPERRVVVTSQRSGDRIRIRFSDNGPGIGAADLPRLFDPFFTRGSGSGLGLSVSYGMVRAAGGELTAENPAGGGAAFTVDLPAS